MAQGAAKLGKARKSKAAQKRHHVRKKTVSKGRKVFHAKGAKASDIYARSTADTTKSINKRNETLVAAKAVSCGSHFFLTDVKDKGTKEMNKQIKERNKKQSKTKAAKKTQRLEEHLKKIS